MFKRITGTRLAVVAPLLACFCASSAADSGEANPAPVPVEPIGVIESLPATYPDSWFFVHDSAFFHMSDGKVYVIDSAAESVAEQVKGTFNISLMGNMLQSAQRGEVYATETFHTRGTRGERSDFLTIWDQATLSPAAEVELPAGKRFMGMPERYALLLLNDQKWLAIANFSPASSVTLVDLDDREILGEIATPGCSMVYPTGDQGFSSLCADGRFLSTRLDDQGGLASQTRTAAFFSSDDNPIFERPAVIGDMAYFPSFDGMLYPVDMSGPVAQPGEAWHLVPEQERDANWAPGGIGIIDVDDQGYFYLLMHPGAVDGSHNGGGPEVWVYDPLSQTRIRRIPLREWGLSLAVSSGPEPRLLVTNPTDMSLELYDARSGDYLRSITGFGQETPLMLHGSR